MRKAWLVDTEENKIVLLMMLDGFKLSMAFVDLWKDEGSYVVQFR